MSHQAPILVVEDSDDHVLLLRLAFEKAGILNPVQVVSSGEDAVAYWGVTTTIRHQSEQLSAEIRKGGNGRRASDTKESTRSPLIRSGVEESQ